MPSSIAIIQGFFFFINKAIEKLSSDQSELVKVLFFAAILAVISLFIFQFYKSTSKKNIIELNLRKYNYSRHPLINKFFAIILYLVEYIIIMPILLILWFVGLALIMLFITNERSIDEILFISASIIGAIRILAYYRSEISKDLAKLFPFITLAVFLLSPRIFNLAKLTNQISEIPLLLNQTISFIFAVFLIEITFRIFSTLHELWKSEGERM